MQCQGFFVKLHHKLSLKDFILIGRRNEQPTDSTLQRINIIILIIIIIIPAPVQRRGGYWQDLK